MLTPGFRVLGFRICTPEASRADMEEACFPLDVGLVNIGTLFSRGCRTILGDRIVAWAALQEVTVTP